jgi:hypothetical protein
MGALSKNVGNILNGRHYSARFWGQLLAMHRVVPSGWHGWLGGHTLQYNQQFCFYMHIY